MNRITFVWLCACIMPANAVESPIGINQVAEAFATPITNIRETIKTEEVVAKYGDAIHSASLFEFKSEPSVTMQVVVTRAHYILTDVLRSKLEGEPALIEKVDLENAGKAFIGIEGVGPGAEAYVAIAHLPSQNLDFRFRVILLNDGITASDAPPASALRSSTLLKKALKTLTISSSAKLFQAAPLASARATSSRLLLEPSRRSEPRTQAVKKAKPEQGIRPQNAYERAIVWKVFTLEIAGVLVLCLVGVYCLWRKRKMNQNNRSK